MPALGAGIHVLNAFEIKDVDGRDKPTAVRFIVRRQKYESYESLTV
jgi:hypothetical protein